MDDKKKLAVVGVLFAVIIAVGAFQFIGGGPEPAPAKPKPVAADGKKPEDVKTVKNALATLELPARDPFKPEALPNSNPRLPDPISPRTVSKRLEPSAQELPPFPIDKSGSLSGVTFKPQPSFGYGLSGVILGERPAAVFVDPQGGERLVKVGEPLDGDTQVIGVEKGTAIVSFRGKTLRISGGIGK